MVAKVVAAKDGFHKIIGTIDTREKHEASDNGPRRMRATQIPLLLFLSTLLDVSASWASDPELDKELPLSAMVGDTEAVDALLKRGADVTGVVDRLIGGGVDLEVRDKNGATALIIAADAGHTEVVATLLAHGAKIDARDDRGATALISAVGRGRTDVTELLLAAGADPNIQDNDGTTALMEAVSSGYNDLIGSLMSYGADPALTDGEGRTAADIARQVSNDEAILSLAWH